MASKNQPIQEPIQEEAQAQVQEDIFKRIYDFSSTQEDIFKRIRDEFNPRDEEQYEDIDIDGIINEEIGYTTPEFNGWESIHRLILYNVVREQLNICWNEYRCWAFKKEEECSCGYYPEGPITCHMCSKMICQGCYEEDDNTFKLIDEEREVYSCGSCDIH